MTQYKYADQTCKLNRLPYNGLCLDYMETLKAPFIGVGRFRILGGPRFRILGGGPRFRILGGPRGAKFPAGT